jgi:hypothetical protein
MTSQQPSSRRPSVRAAEASPELSSLGLAELRTYRAALTAEEERVSYWRRLLQGRVDLLEARAASGDPVTLIDLVRVLGDTGSGRSRRALMLVQSPEELPDLPDLQELTRLWAADPHEADEVADLVERLHGWEKVLSDYRRALHERIDAATGELIVRYRADPAAALALIPAE